MHDHERESVSSVERIMQQNYCFHNMENGCPDVTAFEILRKKRISTVGWMLTFEGRLADVYVLGFGGGFHPQN